MLWTMCIAAEKFHHVVVGKLPCQIANLFTEIASETHDVHLEENASVFQRHEFVEVVNPIQIPFGVCKYQVLAFELQFEEIVSSGDERKCVQNRKRKISSGADV